MSVTTSSPAPPDSATAKPGDPAVHTQAFFEALLEEAPADHHALLWTLQDKKSTWVPLRHGVAGGPDCISERARSLADNGKDVYVAVSLAREAGLHDTRIKSANAAGIFGLWADIDIREADVHKKWNLPPTEEAARELLEASKMPPTVIVHSGHGLQAWWLFNEFWTFGAEEDRLAAASLAQAWNGTLQVHAAAREWVIDSTFDLARVMRVPGTLNRKGEPVMPVRLLEVDGPRWNPHDFEQYFADPALVANVSSKRAYKPDDYELDESLQPDFELFHALLDNDPLFENTWKHKRKDMTDQSPSSYDYSLAIQTVRAGWSDQEIAKLIVQFRKTHRLDVAKALRKDYMDRTIAKARDTIAREEGTEEIDELVEKMEEAVRSGDPEEQRDARRAMLDTAGQQVEIEVLHLYKYLSDPPAYSLATPVKQIPLGDIDGLIQWHKFRASMAAGLNELIPRFKADKWDAVVRLLLKAVEEVDVGAEATEAGEMTAWLSSYLSQRPPVDTLEEAATSEYPYVDPDDGRVVLFGPAFKRWLWLTYQEKVTPKELGRRLTDFGCEPGKINVGAGNKRTSRATWKLPKGVAS